MKIYTKTGDSGTTGLLGRDRVPKDDLRIEVYGTVDELNAALGVVRSHDPAPEIDGPLARIQGELFAAGASLADPAPDGRFHGRITAEAIRRLEVEIDGFEAQLTPLTQFIVPGGTQVAATLHLARTICRRAERLVVHLDRRPGEFVAPILLPYLNRLSDYLFVVARIANHGDGVADTPWQGL